MKDRSQYYKDYRKKNKEKYDAYQKQYREENRGEIAARARAWKGENKEKIAASQKEYAQENKAGLAEYQRGRCRTDPEFRLKKNLRCRLWHALKGQGATKDSTTMKLTGCSVDALTSHLESQFTEGMTWENYGEWHVDHIRPCASFDLTIDKEQKICFNYSNLQPLWAKDNLSKSDKYDELTEANKLK